MKPLHATDTVSYLDPDAISDWLGSPASIGTGTPNATPKLPATTLYLTEAGDGAAVSVNDIHQGQIGDCFLLAPLGELAMAKPSDITNMIHTNADGTETVTLHEAANGSLPQWNTTAFRTVTEIVTNTFASNGVNNGSNQDVVGGQKEIWAQVIEKAVAQLNGGLANIANGGSPLVAMEELTGHATSYTQPGHLTAAGLQAMQAAGNIITFDTGSGSLGYGLVNNHAYMFEGVKTVGGVAEVQLGNPWGPSYNPALIPVSQLSHAFVEVDVGKA